MKYILCLLSATLVCPAPQLSSSANDCTCNGRSNSEGTEACESRYQGRPFCYVDQDKCSDQVASTTQGQWWSYNACEDRTSSQSPNDGSKVSFGEEGEKRVDVRSQCRCNGLYNSRGEGECKTKYRGQNFCYVEKGSCPDATKSTSSDRWWSHQACPQVSSLFIPTDGMDNVVNEVIKNKLKVAGDVATVVLGIPTAIGQAVTNVFSPQKPGSEFTNIDKEEGELECWCEEDKAPLLGQNPISERRGLNTKVSRQPNCRSDQLTVCRRKDQNLDTKVDVDKQDGGEECSCESERAPFVGQNSVNERSIINSRIVNNPKCSQVCSNKEEVVDTAPQAICACNGQLNNEDLRLGACESTFQGARWCYVAPGLCSDEITSESTGKTWSQAACRDFTTN